MNPPVADALVELVVQSQQIGISVLTLGGGRFDGMLGAGVQHGRLGIFADTHLDFSGQVVGVECEPSGVHLSEIEHQGARLVDPDRPAGPDAPRFAGCRPHLDRQGVQLVMLQIVGSQRTFPAVCDERIGRLGNFFSAERTPNGDAKPRCVRTRRGSVARIVRRERGECQQRGQNEGSFHGRVRFDRLEGSLINAADDFPAMHPVFLRRSFRSVRRPIACGLDGLALCRDDRNEPFEPG